MEMIDEYNCTTLGNTATTIIGVVHLQFSYSPIAIQMLDRSS